MKDKVVFIPGAKGGLGSFITRRFLETGVTVVGASRSISQQDFPRPNFPALAVDFTKAAAVNDAVQSVIRPKSRAVAERSLSRSPRSTGTNSWKGHADRQYVASGDGSSAIASRSFRNPPERGR
jgi:NAD(P)-dependent dehydrogenase (short-subunit alcohol dehydrogenase family)